MTFSGPIGPEPRTPGAGRTFRLIFVTAALVGPAVAVQAQQVTVRGRILERDTRASIANATVVLADRPPALSDANGEFRFERVSTGRYILTIDALGWSAEEITLVVRADTTLVIEMARLPVALDTLDVQARRISIRGVVRDSASGLKLIDVGVRASGDRSTTTDPIGRFRFKDVPRNTPFVVHLESLGYGSLTRAIVASQDTSVEITMRPDHVAARMIEVAKERLAERAAPLRYKVKPAITRADLLANINRSVLDVLKDLLRRPIGCVIIDERSGVNNRVLLETMLPDRVEHIDVIEYGRRNTLMVRVFTRDYFPTLMVRQSHIASREDLATWARWGNCR